jgi:long-subunit fatty acid transport protein
MKKFFIPFGAMFICGSIFAGGIVTNSNQSASWVRMPAQDATTGIHAVYYNPAGLVMLNDGIHFSISNQTILQNREVENFYSGPGGIYGLNEPLYKGEVTAPVFPSIYAVYKKDKLAFSLGFNPVGGGGSAEFGRGLPSIEIPPSDLVPSLYKLSPAPSEYRVNAYFKGTSVNLGYQLGISYKINDAISVFGGIRYVTAKNTYQGHLHDVELNMGGSWVRADAVLAGVVQNLDAMLAAPAGLQLIIDGGAGNLTLDQAVAGGTITQEQSDDLTAGLVFIGVPPSNIPFMTINQINGVYVQASPTLSKQRMKSAATGNLLRDQQADVEQTGSGITPVIGANIALYDKINIGIKYEFLTKMNITNNTTEDFTIGYLSNGDSITMFPDGAETPNDMPALLSTGVSILATDKLTLNFGTHIYFDLAANYGKKVNGKFVSNESLIDKNYFEFATGLEYKITDKILVSGGYLVSETGVSNNYQSDLSYSLSSNTLCFGGAVNITDKIKVDLGIGFTTYKNSDKWYSYYSAVEKYYMVNETYYKDNIFFAIGVDVSL